MLTPSDIANKKFEKAAFGYRQEEVDSFIADVASSFSRINEEKNELEQKLEVLADKLEEYRSSEDSLRTVLLGAQKLGDNIIRESKAKAEVMLQEATAKSEALLQEASSRSETMIADTTSKMLHEKEILDNIKREVADFKGRLLSMYRQHLELIAALPEPREENEDQEPQPEEQPAQESQSDAAPEEAAAEETAVS